MMFQCSVPCTLTLYEMTPGDKRRLRYTWREIKAGDVVIADQLEHVTLNDVDELALKIQIDTETLYVLAEDFDTRLKVLCNNWRYAQSRGRTREAQKFRSGVMQALRDYLRPNLHLVPRSVA
jgi:hypothetical protein